MSSKISRSSRMALNAGLFLMYAVAIVMILFHGQWELVDKIGSCSTLTVCSVGYGILAYSTLKIRK